MDFSSFGYTIVCFVIISVIANAFYSNKEGFFTPKGISSLLNNFFISSYQNLQKYKNT